MVWSVGYGEGPTPERLLSTPTPVSDAEFDTRGLIARFSVGVVLLLVGFAILGAVLREPVESAARVWVDTTGLAGMFAAIAVLDSVPSRFRQPLPALPMWRRLLDHRGGGQRGQCDRWHVGMGSCTVVSQTRWFQAFIRGRASRRMHWCSGTA